MTALAGQIAATRPSCDIESANQASAHTAPPAQTTSTAARARRVISAVLESAAACRNGSSARPELPPGRYRTRVTRYRDARFPKVELRPNNVKGRLCSCALAGADSGRAGPRVAPHRPDGRAIRQGDLASHLEAEALVDRDVGFLAGLQIAGHRRGVGDGDVTADHHAAVALALLGRIGADRLQIVVRLMRMALLDHVHDAHHLEAAAEGEHVHERRTVGEILPDRNVPGARWTPERG